MAELLLSVDNVDSEAHTPAFVSFCGLYSFDSSLKSETGSALILVLGGIFFFASYINNNVWVSLAYRFMLRLTYACIWFIKEQKEQKRQKKKTEFRIPVLVTVFCWL